MKKAVVYVLAFAMLLTLLAGCKSNSGPGVKAQAYFTAAELTLPVAAELNEGDYVSYGGYSFENKKNISKLAQLVQKNNDGITAEEFTNAYGKCWLFCREEGGSVDSWCLYEQDPANIKNWFIFSGLYRELVTDEGSFRLMLPLHLISDSYIRDNMQNHITVGSGYACGCEGKEDSLASQFRAFYEASGLFMVGDAENGFTVVSPEMPDMTLLFRFEEQDGSGTFYIEDVTEREPEPTDNVTVRWVADADAEAVDAALSADDALALSSVLISIEYVAEDPEIEYPYSFNVDGETYAARLLWENDKWNGSVCRSHKTSTLTTAQASVIAACMYNSGVLGPMSEAQSALGEELLRVSTAMKTVTEVNLRAEPSTSATIIKTMAEGDVVAVSGKTDKWYQIIFGDTIGYMSADYLQLA